MTLVPRATGNGSSGLRAGTDGSSGLRAGVSASVLTLSLLLASSASAAQPVTIDATLDQSVVGLNQPIELTVSVTTRGVSISHVELPKSDGLQLMGTSQSEQSSFSMGPGGIDSSHTTSYHLSYRAQKVGDVTLSPVQVIAGGHSYQGGDLHVKIVPANQAPGRQQQQQQQRQRDPFGSFFGGGGFPPPPGSRLLRRAARPIRTPRTIRSRSCSGATVIRPAERT